jgi:hypothetical protein
MSYGIYAGGHYIKKSTSTVPLFAYSQEVYYYPSDTYNLKYGVRKMLTPSDSIHRMVKIAPEFLALWEKEDD